MRDQHKTKTQLIKELVELRQRIAELEKSGDARRPAEEALRESEEQLNLAVGGSKGGLWDLGFSSNSPSAAIPDEIYLSPALKKFIGYEDDEFPNSVKAWQSQIALDDLPVLHKSAQDHFEGKADLHEAQYRIRHKDGSIRWIHTRGKILRDEHEKPLRWVGIDWDITKQKRGEEALRESEEKYRDVYNYAPLGFVIWGKDCRIIEWNEQAEVMFGWSHHEAVGRNFFDLIISERSRQRVEGIVDDLMRGRIERHIIHENVKKSGEPIWCEWNNAVLRNSEGGIVGAISLALDITEHKQAEEKILRQNALVNGMNRVLRETLRCETDEEVARTCLAVAEELTGSQFGWIGEINEEGRLDSIAQSNTGWEVCKMPKLESPPRMTRNMEIRGIWGEVIKGERSLIINDPASHPASVGIPDGHPPITSFLGVPLKQGGKTVGMIALANKEAGYDLADQQDVETLSVSFVESLNRKRMEEALRRSEDSAKQLAQENEVMAEIGRVINSSLNIEEVYDRFAMEVRKLIPFDRIAIHLINHEAGTITIAYVSGVAVKGGLQGDVIPLHGTATEEVLQVQSSLLVQGEDKNAISHRFPTFLPYLDAGFLSAIMVPLISKDRVISILSFRSTRSNAYTEEDLRLAEKVGNQIAGAVDNAEFFSRQMRIEEALRRRERELAVIFDGAPVFMLVVDRDYRVRKANRTAEAAVGATEAKLRGIPCGDVLRCLHRLDSPDGCCHGLMCETCVLRRAVQNTLETGLGVLGVEADFEMETNGHPRRRSFSLSTSLLEIGGEAMVLVCLEDITDRKRAEEEVRKSHEELRALTAELSIIEERERHRIAEDLHDHIGQALAMAKVKLGALRENSSFNEFILLTDEIRGLVGEAIEYTRSLIFDLSPPALYELGFEAALESLAEQIRDQHNLQIDFEADGQCNSIGGEIRISLYKAVKELLINIVKHARARNAKVSIKREDTGVRIIVEDDGVGFIPSESKEGGKLAGFGLVSVRERLRHMGGSIEIASNPGRGTRILLRAPIRQEENDSGRVI